MAFIIYRPDDESMTVFLNGKEVGSANHDSDGWKGMETVEEIVTEIAKVLGLPVETEYSEPPEDSTEEDDETS